MTVYVISDLHLGHKNVLNFKNADGSRLRPFDTIAEMHAAMAYGWDAMIVPEDKVYVLGDVSMSKSREVQGWIHDRPGQKRLVKGNHDLFPDKWYHEAGFKTLHGVRNINNVWLTHVPMHPQSLSGRAVGNIHGHLHGNHVMLPGLAHTHPMPDRRYFNACVEPLSYTPISLDTVVEWRGWKEVL